MPRITRLSRRAALAAAIGTAATLALPGPSLAQAPGAAQEIANHFTRVRTMMGEFVQFGPSGEQTGGRFFIERPGRVLFLYEEPSNIRVVADGDNVVVNNKKLSTWDIYPLGKTPLNLILGDRIDLGGGRVVSVTEDDDLTTIVMQDKQVFGDSQITMMFDPQSYDLRQWTIRDAKGQDTTVMIYNVRKGVTFGPDTFEIDYNRIRRERASR
ncbi:MULTISPECIES: outer membrane lipoprotein carrier protein LolA [unclassified Roseitalea]|uniref:outer membrane lipoprotein carrier protein LolA n=1 Tax=unclassified Roseitalea TaxID=2639107 RepID=UPI00273E5D4F|nr:MULTISPECIES: outer membrane lipoprotein carrier protein LolA [unclassified Roseitalea]